MSREAFFESGFVELEYCDFETRQACVCICMPSTLFTAVSPHILNAGYVDYFRVHDPLSIWLPALQDDDFNRIANSPGIASKINVALREEVLKITRLFSHLSSYLNDPARIIPILPLGVYVEFKYRCEVDKILPLLEGIDKINLIGVHEFQWAFATILKIILEDFDRVMKTNYSARLLHTS